MEIDDKAGARAAVADNSKLPVDTMLLKRLPDQSDIPLIILDQDNRGRERWWSFCWLRRRPEL
jgi:predicted dithiol-disulfide oxidoreductase (DUF899 family)